MEQSYAEWSCQKMQCSPVKKSQLVRRQILQSGDEKLISIISQLPEESWAHLREILSHDIKLRI